MFIRALLACCCLQLACGQSAQRGGQGRGLQQVFAWKQLTYNIGGRAVLQDRFGGEEETPDAASRQTRQARGNSRGQAGTAEADRVLFPQNDADNNTWTDTVPDSRKFFIQYNNVPMGVTRAGSRLFVTVPRRRYGIPATLNYIDLNADSNTISPGLRPYPSLKRGKSLVSVYRTRLDSCNRLWMVDTGMLEIPDNRQQVQPPAIVVFDLNTDREVLRYQFKSTDLVNERTPAGLASITVDVEEGRCDSAFAYIVDLATYGLIVYSMQDNDSWRVNHNFFSFNPLVGNLNIAGQSFQWNDGIFSITLSERQPDGFKTAYFHPMVSIQEFKVSTRVLRDRTLATREFHGEDFQLVGERGNDSQSTLHGYHAPSGVIFYAEVGRDAVSCWNTRMPLSRDNIATIAQDHEKMVYPSDLQVTGDEVWLMSNTMPRFIYATLDTNQYNFRIYKGTVKDLIAGTVCDSHRPSATTRRPGRPGYDGGRPSFKPRD